MPAQTSRNNMVSGERWTATGAARECPGLGGEHRKRRDFHQPENPAHFGSRRLGRTGEGIQQPGKAGARERMRWAMLIGLRGSRVAVCFVPAARREVLFSLSGARPRVGRFLATATAGESQVAHVPRRRDELQYRQEHDSDSCAAGRIVTPREVVPGKHARETQPRAPAATLEQAERGLVELFPRRDSNRKAAMSWQALRRPSNC